MSPVDLRVAREDEATEVHRFIFGDGERPNLRSRPVEDVERIIQQRLMFVAVDQHVVSACFVDDADDSSVEFGGAYTEPSHRGKGIGTALHIVALTHVIFMNYRQVPIVSHVVASNDAPRNVLARIGFRLRSSDV